MTKIHPKKAFDMQKKLIGSVPKGNTYSHVGNKKPIRRK